MRSRSAVVLLLSCAGLRSWAQAPPEPPISPAAQPHMDAATRAFELMDYGQAAEALRAAHRVDPQPRFLYALAQAERLRGDCRAAIRAYADFLATSPPDWQARPARQNIARCQRQLAAATPATRPPSPVATAATSHPATAAAAPPRVVRFMPRPWYTDLVGNTLGVSGVVFLVTGAIVWAVGKDGIDQARAATGYDGFESRVLAGRTKERVGVAFMAAGGALVGAGVVRYLLRPGARRVEVVVSGAPVGGGGSLLVTGRF
ncbi:MAG: hypothetical protein HY906_12105 [Deltaproteobacteria bacterium]|nr:hypothetical protein [Deltaproteobacteria bacterium]